MLSLVVNQFLWIFLPGTISGSESQEVHVNGLLNHYVYLKMYLNITIPVKEVFWHFKANGKKITFADYRTQALNIHLRQFMNRLDDYNNGTTLRIRELRMEDSGLYTAMITLVDQESKDMSFNLTVYEPVPTPEIKTQLDKKSKDWCNFTLDCCVPENTSSLSIIWKKRQSDLGYQHYKNGSKIYTSLESKALNTEFICFLLNPVDQKNASVHAEEICSVSESGLCQHYRCYYFILLSLIVFLAIVLLFVVKTKRKKESFQSPTASIYNETNYIEVYSSQPNESDQDVCPPEQRATNLPKKRLETVYTEIQPNV